MVMDDTAALAALIGRRYGACHFAASIRATGEEGSHRWWEARYAAADQIARWARQRFRDRTGL